MRDVSDRRRGLCLPAIDLSIWTRPDLDIPSSLSVHICHGAWLGCSEALVREAGPCVSE